jgi:hypothetical protein
VQEIDAAPIPLMITALVILKTIVGVSVDRAHFINMKTSLLLHECLLNIKNTRQLMNDEIERVRRHNVWDCVCY